MFVLTADQHASQRTGDDVPAMLQSLAQTPGLETVRAFERTVGDEIQAVLPCAGTVMTALTRLHRHGQWAVGIGAGRIDHLAGTASASAGPAFVAAREAVERARSKAVPVPMAIAWPQAERGPSIGHAEALLQLISSVFRRRSAAGWEVIDRLPDHTQAEVAAQLEISPAAVSQRLRTAQWSETQAVTGLMEDLLTRVAKHAEDDAQEEACTQF